MADTVFARLRVGVGACYVGTGCFPMGCKQQVGLLAHAAIPTSFVASSILNSVLLHLWKV